DTRGDGNESAQDSLNLLFRPPMFPLLLPQMMAGRTGHRVRPVPVPGGSFYQEEHPMSPPNPTPKCRRGVLLKVVIIGFALVNRIGTDILFGGKNRVCPSDQPGGFPWEATRQALALEMKPTVMTMVGNDPSGDFVIDTLHDTGADLGGIHRGAAPTLEAEV